MRAASTGKSSLPRPHLRPKRARPQSRNARTRSFLYYVPYVTLAVMTFPSILTATGSVWSAWLGFAAALFCAWRGMGLLPVACAACAAVFLSEFFLL